MGCKFFVFLALALVPVASAQAEETSLEASAGDLRIIHLWSTDSKGFQEAWAGPTPPSLPITTKTVRNRPIQQFILYANCKRDAEQRCHLTARAAITAPDGTPYGEPMTFEALPLSKAVPNGSIGMAPNSIGLRVEDGEQLGRYRVELAVTDEIGGTTATHVAEIDVAEADGGA